MGGRGRLWDPRRWLSWGKHVGVALGKSGAAIPGVRCPLALSRRVPDAKPPRKASREAAGGCTKTDTRGQVETTKCIEITLVNILDATTPEVPDNGRPSSANCLAK